MAKLKDYYNIQLQGMQPLSGRQLTPVQKPQPVVPVVPKVDTSNAMESLAYMMGPTPAEREAQVRKAQEHESKMQAWTGLFDGLRNLGNLYSTYKGASPQQTANYNPYAQISRQVQQQQLIQDSLDNYRRQYEQGIYNLRRQADEDRMKSETHQAQLDWYKNRDEQNAEKVAIQKFRAETDRDYKTATLEQKEKMNDIMADVYAGRISLMEAQQRLANVRAAKTQADASGNTKTIVEGGKTKTITTTPNTARNTPRIRSRYGRTSQTATNNSGFFNS